MIAQRIKNFVICAKKITPDQDLYQEPNQG